MADVYAVFGSLLALGIAFPGMLTAWWLMFPGLTDRASTRFELSPWKSLALGGLLALPLVVVLVVLFASPLGPVKFIGSLMLIGALAFASLGASGLAALMGRRISARSSSELSDIAAFVRGALALELAAAFPVIGWLLVIPAVTVSGFGAAAFALLGWVPQPVVGKPVQGESSATQTAPPASESPDEPALDPAGA